MRISVDEILTAIEESAIHHERPDGTFTTPELAEALGWGEPRVRKAIRQLIDSGRAEPIMAPRRSMTGVTYRRAAYRLIRNGDS